MGFIEDERRRRENLAKGNTEKTIVKTAGETRLSRTEAELWVKALRKKSASYYRESFTPRLVEELSRVVKGNVLLFGYEEGDPVLLLRQLREDAKVDVSHSGGILLSLHWDERELHGQGGGDDKLELDLLANRHRYGMHLSYEFRGSYRYFLSKSIEIIFSPTGIIRFNAGFIAGKSGSSEISYEQWKGKKDVEEGALEKAFRIPGEYIREKQRPNSSGGDPGAPGIGSY